MRHRLNDERGFTLLLALGALVALTITVTGLIEYTSSNSRASSSSRAKQTANGLAEAGINNAISVLNATDAKSQTSLPTTKSTNVSYWKQYPDGKAYWWGTYDTSNPAAPTWHLTGQGEVTTNGITVIHKTTADVTVTTSLTQTLNTQQWDYVMSTGTGTPCDQTIADGGNTGNPSIILSRLYVFGNLCLGTNQGGVGNINAGPLLVKGKLNVNSSSSGVGSSGSPVNEVHVGGGCSLLGGTTHSPCGTADNVWATLRDAVVPNVAAPVADFTSWYTNASPGPKNACATTSGTPPTWDNNTVKDKSITTAFELTPASSYSCSTSSGSISWNASTKLLTVSGTMYIDGSAKMTNGALNQYNGQATLYLSGTFYMSSGTKMCGGVSGSSCDFTNWNPNTELFAVVADGTGAPSPVPAGVSIDLSSAAWQGALYGTGKIRLEGTTQSDGPLVASEVQLGYNVSTSSASAYGFPSITTVPAGLPGMPPNVHALPQAPKYTSG